MARFYSQNLKFLRQNKNMSQQGLAEKLNVDRSTVSRWENDEMDITVGNAILISNFFNVPLEKFTNVDLSNPDNVTYDELDVLFNKYKDKLSDKDKEHIKFIIEQTKKDIDKQLGDDKS